MDLSTIDNHPMEKGASLIIKDHEGNDTDIKITVISMKSNKAQKLFLANRDKDSDVKLAALLTVGWENIMLNGKEVVFSIDEAIKLYENYPLIGNQVSAFILNEQNFLKKKLDDLILYVRQLAYYRTTPHKSKTARYEYHKENLQFPKVEDEYLISYFELLGCHKQSFPLDYSEIKAFSELMELSLSIYEVVTLRKMSEAYLVECSNKEQNAPIPYMEGERKKIPLSVLKAKFGIE